MTIGTINQKAEPDQLLLNTT